ncbi:hypothetical protein ACIBKY_28555 [Nonomuraea sp. NPDC050394]|uniref:hypothetical protein n=1 Tax=Nonomuraea sp. NPDC050394 TaxID=3364363 RepID=UPI003792B528
MNVREQLLGLSCGACGGEDMLWLDLGLLVVECAACQARARVEIDGADGNGGCPFKTRTSGGAQ